MPPDQYSGLTGKLRGLGELTTGYMRDWSVEIYDLRLGTDVPKKKLMTYVITADEHATITSIFIKAKALSVEHTIGTLRFFGHGNEGSIDVGKDELNYVNAFQMKLLAGKLTIDSLIVLYACSSAGSLRPTSGPGSTSDYARAANLTPNYVKQIAAVTGVPVLAARDLQWYNHNPIQFGRWEGNVYVITPRGAVVRVPNLGSLHVNAIREMRAAGLSDRVIYRLHEEVVMQHPDYVLPKA